MNVRSGISLWQGLEDRPAEAPALDDDVSCEVAIVGGGVTGVLVADCLLREGVDAILLDKRDFGAGSTAASTGLLQYEADTPLCELIGKVGESSAVTSYRLGLRAIDEIERLVGELPGDCGFSRKTSFYLASSPADLASLQKEYDCRNEYGFDVSFLRAGELAQIGAFTSPGAIRSTGDGEIDPLRFTQSLLARARTAGLCAYARCEVTGVTPNGEGIVLTTSLARVSARRVVIATGYAANRMLKQDVGSLHSTYAAASAPLASFAGWPERCLVWETDRPYFYLRSTPDGRAIAGGEDTPYSTDHEARRPGECQSAAVAGTVRKNVPGDSLRPRIRLGGNFRRDERRTCLYRRVARIPKCILRAGLWRERDHVRRHCGTHHHGPVCATRESECVYFPV